MPTNNETIKKLEKRLHDEFLVPPLLFVQLEALVDKRAKADTAKQIFKELDEAVWEQIEPSRLEEFLEQFSNAKDLKASLNVATAFSIIGLDAEKYEALKKQFNIED